MTPPAPRVSIVLPIYNYEHYLHERMRSLLAQTFTDFELIAVDDGSTDGSRAVVERYRSDPRLRTIWFDTNGGHPYLRWNDGAAEARGEYVLFAGADDSCEPTLLETLVATLDAHPEVGLAHTRCLVIDAEGRPTGLLPRQERWDHDFIADADTEAPHLFIRNTIPNASAALMRRSVFEACGRFDIGLRLCADHLLYARMLRQASVAYHAAPLNHFRTHPRTLRSTESAGYLLLETYQTLAYMRGAFAIDPEVMAASFRRGAREWIRLLLRARSVRALRTAWAVRAAARAVDPSFDPRVARLARHDAARRLFARGEA